MRVAFYTLGCKVNQYETEELRKKFCSAGAEVVSDDIPADVYVVNTCTVTGIADRKSRQHIRRMKSLNPDALMVVTGCYADVSAEDVAAMPEVDLVIGNAGKPRLVDTVLEVCTQSHLYDGGAGSVPAACEDSGGRSRAYIKIQEGCNRFCSYCKIPYARSIVRSRAPEEIIEEAKALILQGYREIVLTGINTALYGTEAGFDFIRLPEEIGLTGLEALIHRLNMIDADFRIRLSSLEPTVVNREHVESLLKYDKLCRHLHLSIQSGSDHVLGMMNRHYSVSDYLEIVRAVRDFDSCYNITTDIIAGFPGETDEDHAETVRLIGKACFGRVHVFRYSPRKGTAAASMPGQIDGLTKAARAAELISAAEESARGFIERCASTPHRFLAEEREKGMMTGYTGNYIRVYVKDPAEALVPGEFYNIKLTGAYRDGAIAEIVN